MKLKLKHLLIPIIVLLFLIIPTIALLFVESSFSLSSIDFGVLQPMGEVAYKQYNLLILCVSLMLIVVIPTIVLSIVISLKYRHNRNSTYHPEWSHNTMLEIVWWAIPIVIVSILAFLTWKSSHELDPYKPLVSDEKPIRIQVISLPWKWLFIYPEYGIATINFIQFPVGVPINFEITADSPMNSFFIPQLGSQIYAMNGMQSKLHLIANHAKDYRGISANYSGAGFSGMKFIARASTKEEFETWVKDVKNSNNPLSWKHYEEIAKPSENELRQVFSTTEEGIYMKVMNKYMIEGHGSHTNNNKNIHEHNH